jgi:site-specific DNA-methyltransferase (adenine-specific)
VGLEWDPKVIANLQGEITLADMFTPKELEAVMKTLRSKAVTADDATEPPAEPETKVGDLYILGDHRLLCGDSTNPEDFAKLMDGAYAHLCWTDPPYNVNYEGGGMTIANDDMPDLDFRALLDAAFKNVAEHLDAGAMAYVAHSDSYGHEFRGAATGAGLELQACLAWVKSAFVMGRSDYHWQHEPILYLWKPGAPRRWFANRKQTTVLEFDRPAKCDVHPTMKPVALVQYCLENSSAPGDIVLDAFGGSGTTLMASEAIGRKARLMELDPGYCDVIVNRWEQATGREAERIRG